MPVEPGIRTGVGIDGMEERELRQSLLDHFGERDLRFEESGIRTLVLDRPAPGWARLRYGSMVDPETYLRVRIRWMERGPRDWWVSQELSIVTERGSGFEREIPQEGRRRREVQQWLDDWKAGVLAVKGEGGQVEGESGSPVDP